MKQALLGAALLAGAALFASPASADLIFIGPVRPANRAVYERIYQAAPERVKRVDVRVEETTANLRGYRALYLWAADVRTIKIRPDLKPGERPHIFAHELGHHFHSWCLTGAEYARWEGWWAANKRLLPKDEDNARYARKNAREGFAVSAEFWLRGKPLNPAITALFREFYP